MGAKKRRKKDVRSLEVRKMDILIANLELHQLEIELSQKQKKFHLEIRRFRSAQVRAFVAWLDKTDQYWCGLCNKVHAEEPMLLARLFLDERYRLTSENYRADLHEASLIRVCDGCFNGTVIRSSGDFVYQGGERMECDLSAVHIVEWPRCEVARRTWVDDPTAVPDDQGCIPMLPGPINWQPLPAMTKHLFAPSLLSPDLAARAGIPDLDEHEFPSKPYESIYDLAGLTPELSGM